MRQKIDKIIENRLFTVYGKRRKTPNEFTELADAMENFKQEVFKALRKTHIIEWLCK